MEHSALSSANMPFLYFTAFNFLLKAFFFYFFINDFTAQYNKNINIKGKNIVIKKMPK